MPQGIVHIAGGRGSGKLTAAMADLRKRDPELHDFVQSLPWDDRIGLSIAISETTVTLRFGRRYCSLTAHQVAPGWWAAEVHQDLRTTDGPEVCLPRDVHAEHSDRIQAIRDAFAEFKRQ